MKQNTSVSGSAQEIIDYLQNDRSSAKHLLIVAPAEAATDTALPALSADEEERLLDELGELGKGRVDPSLTYDRNDIYFDR